MAATESPSQASENQDAIALFRRVYIFMGIELSGFGGGRVDESGILEISNMHLEFTQICKALLISWRMSVHALQGGPGLSSYAPQCLLPPCNCRRMHI